MTDPRPHLRELLRGTLDLVWPPRCLVCDAGVPAGHFCDACRLALTTDHPHRCRFCAGNVGPHADPTKPCLRCEKTPFAFASACRFGYYDGVLRLAVIRLKHTAGELLASRLGELWAESRRADLLACAPQVVVPVPLHWRRRWQRGYNQSEELARSLAATLGLPVVADALRRTRATDFQPALSATQRWANVKGVFSVRRPDMVRGLRVMLVDDVLTTGATCDAAAGALFAAGAAQVHVAVLSHR
jgi:ComF family protein